MLTLAYLWYLANARGPGRFYLIPMACDAVRIFILASRSALGDSQRVAPAITSTTKPFPVFLQSS